MAEEGAEVAVDQSQPTTDLTVRAGNDGIIEIALFHGGQEWIFPLSPEQASSYAAMLLLSMKATAWRSGKEAAVLPAGQISSKLPIWDAKWRFGSTEKGQRAILVTIGQSHVAFGIAEDHMRALGRAILVSSWDARSQLSAARLLALVLSDFSADLRRWWKLSTKRASEATLRHSAEVRKLLSGRSLWMFRELRVGPGIPTPEYKPVGKCIYCGSLRYSERPGLESRKFGAEHVIPEGIGGTIELPESSCQKCEERTGALVEGNVLGKTLKALRVFLNLKKPGSGPQPKTLPLDAQVDGVRNLIREVPIEDYPIIFNMIVYGAPSVDPTHGPTMHGAILVTLRYDMPMLFAKYNVTGFASTFWDNHMLSRMLAKIGHSFAVAELGESGFRPLLSDMICGKEIESMRLVGGEPLSRPASTSLHEIGLGYQRFETKIYVVAKIRLFAQHGGPTYLVIVGESRESHIAKLKRVFANKISLIPSR